MGEFFTWQAIVMLLIGVFFGSSIKGVLNKAKSKV